MKYETMAVAGSFQQPQSAPRPIGALRSLVMGLHQAINSAEGQIDRLDRAYHSLRTPPPAPVPTTAQSRGAGDSPVPNTLEAELQHLQRRLDLLNSYLATLADGFDSAL